MLLKSNKNTLCLATPDWPGLIEQIAGPYRPRHDTKSVWLHRAAIRCGLTDRQVDYLFRQRPDPRWSTGIKVLEAARKANSSLAAARLDALTLASSFESLANGKGMDRATANKLFAAAALLRGETGAGNDGA